MPRFTYQSHHIDFIRSYCGTMPAAEIAESFNFAFGTTITEKALRSIARRYGISVKHEASYKQALKYSDEQIEWLRVAYRTMTPKQMCAPFNERFGLNETWKQIRAFLHNHRFQSGRTGRFEKNQVPHNKGKKGWSAGGNSEKTRFKKGHSSHNRMPVGSEVVDRDGYRKVKVAEPNCWEFLHRKIWQEEHGVIPNGMMLRFIDGDKSNCSLDNLALIDRGVNAVMNKMRASDYSPETQPALITLAKLKVTKSRREKDQSEPRSGS
ncbi:MAG: HNH endonuclease [Idiomarina sp.]|nr:HNH endonuclease [Idiomarina sp.]